MKRLFSKLQRGCETLEQMLHFQSRKVEELDFWQSLLNRRVVAGQIAEREAKIGSMMMTPQASGQKIDLQQALAEYEAVEASSTWADARTDARLAEGLPRGTLGGGL